MTRGESKLGVTLKHVWQADRGFGSPKSEIVRFVASSGDYLVFLDGDCIARPNFVAAHRGLAEQGFFVSGNRVLLSRALTEDVLANNLEPEHWTLCRLGAASRAG